MESGRGCEKSQRSWIRRCWTVVEIFSVILTAVFMLVVVKSLLRNTECEVKSSSRRILTDESTKRLESICNVTLYSDQCYSTLMSVNSTEPRVLFRASLVTAVEEHVKILGFLSKLVSSEESVKSSLKVCDEMIGDALESLKETIERFDEFGKVMTDVDIDEIRGTLTYAIIDYETCLEGFDEVKEFDFSSYQRNIELIKSLKGYMKKGKELVSNSLAIFTKILGGFAKQVDKSLLDSSNMVESLMSCRLTPNVTVAKDGTGNYQTLSEAVASIPENSKSRFVIHVKEGKYFENVNVPRKKYNVVVYGDGIQKTIVSSNINKIDKPNIHTYQTATFSVSGRWFVVRDMKFVNTAGPGKGQAVAFHSDAKHSVMYRCAFDGFQDTLYAHAGRQLYKECDIVGTIDFIFGHAAAVFQNCTIRPRQPLPKQFNTITAQSGGNYANMISGFSIVNSKIYPFQEDLMAKTYLGRPWNAYSTVVVMKTQIEKLIDSRVGFRGTTRRVLRPQLPMEST
ncbi:Pectinesterase 1 [Cardamine amara subsp. amara]|uniref:Pectinesterase n=1 Tax=Cardamine amara subsp. amara TaxID=228776 RepID=A0ABD0Z782_CARAN